MCCIWYMYKIMTVNDFMHIIVAIITTVVLTKQTLSDAANLIDQIGTGAFSTIL